MNIKVLIIVVKVVCTWWRQLLNTFKFRWFCQGCLPMVETTPVIQLQSLMIFDQSSLSVVINQWKLDTKLETLRTHYVRMSGPVVLYRQGCSTKRYV